MGLDPETVPLCEKCGKRHVRRINGGHWVLSCAKHRRRRDPGDPMRPCLRMRLRGADHCDWCGASGKVRAAAKRRDRRDRAMALLADELARNGRSIDDVDEHEEIRRLIAVESQAEEVLRRLVGELQAGGLIDEDGKQKPGIYGPNHLGDGAPHVLWGMWQQSKRDLARYSKTAADMGVAERRQSLAERHGDAIGDLLEAVVKGLGHDPRDPEVGGLVAAELERFGAVVDVPASAVREVGPKAEGTS